MALEHGLSNSQPGAEGILCLSCPTTAAHLSSAGDTDAPATPCRCIKPNPQSQPGSLDPNYVLEQLRAGGVLEAVRIACAGFPTRKPYRPFAMRYNILLASGRGAYHHLDPETLQASIPKMIHTIFFLNPLQCGIISCWPVAEGPTIIWTLRLFRQVLPKCYMPCFS